MKQVIFIRHAKSSWDNPSLRDIDRPLNSRGLRDAPFMAQLMAGKALRVDALVSSPARRAMDTAQYFAKAFDVENNDIQQVASLYHADPEEVLSVIQNLEASLGSILIFGHNPGYTELANFFSPEYIGNVPTCGIFEVIAPVEHWKDFNQDSGRMVAFHYPKQFFTKK